MKKTVFIVVAMAMMVGGCAGFALVESGKEAKIGDHLVSMPKRDWNSIKDGNVDVWTLDGPALQQIIFVKGAKDGDYLIPIREAGVILDGDDVPRFEKDMSSIEVIELFESTLSRMKAQKTEIRDVRPHKTPHMEGFRFDFSFKTEDGLDKEGAAFGALEKDRLYMAIYIGTKLHYFEKGKEDFEGVVRSLRLL